MIRRYLYPNFEMNKMVYDIKKTMYDSAYASRIINDISYPTGFFYTIYNENGAAVFQNSRGSHGGHPISNERKRIRDNRRVEKEDMKENEKYIRELSASSKVISDSENVEISFYYRYFKKFKSSAAYHNDYYCLDKGSYKVTFYYCFYIQDLVDDPYELLIFKKIVERNQINPNHIFQGCIKSNTVKLIVK